MLSLLYIYIFDIFSLTMSKKRQDKTGTGNSRGRQKTWADNDMVSAMNAVKSSRFTITAAATQFSVPRKTLDNRIKGRVTHGSKPGVSTALTSIEEESLVSYVIYMANRGFPLTRTMVKAFAWSIAKRCGTCDRFNTEYGPGEKWWTLFKQRHPQLALLHFRSDSDSDNNDGSICTICGCNEPEGLGDEIVFWIDCSICGEWAHNLCAFGKNSITRQYVCINCSRSLNIQALKFFPFISFIYNWFLVFFFFMFMH